MADATLGNLSVILGGDASALDKMLAGAQNSVSAFAKNVGAIAGGIGLEKAITGAVSSFVDMIKQGLADADAMSKLSISTGEAVDQVAKLKYAADLTGVGTDALGKSLQNLSVGLSDLASGKVTPAAQALQAMGVIAKNADGTLKTSTQTLADIADKFASYKDGAAKAALAQQLFGAGGEAMIPLLNKGRTGLQDLGDQAQRYGLVLDGETQFAVQSLNDNLKKMDAIKQGLALTITSKMLPAFEQISVVMLDAKENSHLMSEVADGLTAVLKGTISIGLQAVVMFQRLSAEISALVGALKSGDWLHLGDTIKTAWAAMEVEGQKTVEVFNDLDKSISRIGISGLAMWDEQTHHIDYMLSVMNKVGDAIKQTNAPIAGAIDATRNALDLFLDKTAKTTAAIEAEAQTVGMSTDAQARLKIQLEAAAIAKSKDIDLTDKMRASIAAAADASALAAQKLAGAQLTQASLAPGDARNVQLAKYNELLSAGAISMQTFSTASLKLQFPSFTAAAQSAMDFKMQVDTLSTSLMNGLASTLAQVVTGAKSAAEAFSAFALQIVTQLAEMIIKAVLFKLIMTAIGFAGGGPVGMDQSMSGTGLSLTGTGGLFDGGSYTGPGGKFEPAGVVHKGEVVFSQDDVARFGGVANVEAMRLGRGPGYAGGGPVSAGVSAMASTSVPQVPVGARVIEVRGLNPREFYTRDHVAVLMDKINGMIGNGYTLKVA